MNGIVYLFSLWLLLLSGLPCPDTDCCHAEKGHPATTSVPYSSDGHDHKAPCSPFCSCAICAGFSIPQAFRYTLPAEPEPVLIAQNVFTYQPSGYSDVAYSVWQPPKL